ncbi:hypothetical protein [Halomonas urumqiensis]|uniref:Uncharacterized protein n=1 Tax=Halomonas urumqiensis TaxID=1684789 RepID=A0A2N7UDP5_9GAMM|nr:hypothetical protein [Halomonas urumqiensis]PMR78578.1 hypothetical protein C1H70_17740 [Halomonas urumqiensis]PTB03722.1 hypothetical protein C6V82_04370 [Halomonas urumqiensis]GHE20057.1 hypothetical protein GCM10017767_05780 [Halomonas urumqiensis]
MILRTLSLLRSLQGANDTFQDVQGRVQRACDYRWLRGELASGCVTAWHSVLADGTPALGITLPFAATRQRLRGGNWPTDAAARERCFVTGADACRAAGAPGFRTLESLSQGVVHGGINVMRDAARFAYLQEHQALRLTWRSTPSLPAELTRRLPGAPGDGDGWLLLEVRVPAPSRAQTQSDHLDGEWLDARLDHYRRILPPSATR